MQYHCDTCLDSVNHSLLESFCHVLQNHVATFSFLSSNLSNQSLHSKNQSRNCGFIAIVLSYKRFYIINMNQLQYCILQGLLVFQSGQWSFSYTEVYVLMNSPWDVEEWKESVSWILDESQRLTKHLRNKVSWMDFQKQPWRFRSALAEKWACWWVLQMALLQCCTMDWKDAKIYC